MKITKSQLKQIIEEEMKNIVSEKDLKPLGSLTAPEVTQASYLPEKGSWREGYGEAVENLHTIAADLLKRIEDLKALGAEGPGNVSTDLE